ncbi:MAG: hypothetical protein AB2L12_17600 [Smithellaceae bacterium]
MSNKLKLMIVISFTAFISTAFIYLNPRTSFANPPQAITLEYNLIEKTLSVTITHKSPFPSSHYIKYVEILKNGKSAGSNTYESQPDNLKFTYVYKIPALENDIFEVTGRCSIWGSKTVSFTVGKGK